MNEARCSTNLQNASALTIGGGEIQAPIRRQTLSSAGFKYQGSLSYARGAYSTRRRVIMVAYGADPATTIE